ncbi:pilus assembly protein HicB [Sodaliphilus sp.]|uniref:pilus assembly protein HicB n=1 Tax=Sodaliphilus sp. TaxID=2815818 RepID=UPI00388FAC77
MKVKIEKQSDGTYIAYNIGGVKVQLIGSGDTVAEAKEDFMNSVQEITESYAEDGVEVPAELSEAIEFNFDISSLFEYYSVINISAFAKMVGINDSLLRQYKRGNTYISDAQLGKIEEGIHKLGKELSSLRLV